MAKKDETNWRAATQLVRGGVDRSEHFETSEALYMTSGYVYDCAEDAEKAFTGEAPRYVYSRYGNPTVTMFQDRLKALEGAAYCFATASGMAAVHAAILAPLRSGDRVVASRALFGSNDFIMTNLLPRYGIEGVLVDGTDLAQWEDALSQPTQAVLIESPSNPTLEIIDIQAVSDIAHKAGARVIVDNVFATPLLQKPFELGADVVVYSTTKHIDGQGRTMGGAILTNDQAYFDDELIPFVRNVGPSISPFNAWLLLKGLETLDLRVARMGDNAHAIAEFLSTQTGIKKVLYPGLKSHPQHDLAMAQMSGKGGTIVSFEVDGGKAEAFKLLNALKIIDISNNVGDSKSLITHPSTTTHFRLSEEARVQAGISQGTIRLSVGLEDVDDLKEDLAQALS